MSTTRILDQLLVSNPNRYELVLKVAQRAKQIKSETRDQPRATNPVIQALQMVLPRGMEPSLSPQQVRVISAFIKQKQLKNE